VKKIIVCGLFLAAAAVSRAQDPYADTVVSYVPGTGESASFENNSSAALGAPTSAATITAPAYLNTELTGIGNGGELTVEFDTPISNDPGEHADGMDFTIFGNEFFESGGSGISSVYDHPGLSVWVSADNITYYQLAAPQGADDSFPTEGSGDPGLPVSSSLSLSSFTGLSPAAALGLYDGSAGGSSYSISWAEDAQGDSVDLPSISYIKIEGTGGYGYVDAIARVESVPEPGVAGLLIVGALIFGGWRRRARVN